MKKLFTIYFICCFASVWGQFTTATIDGDVSTSEYGIQNTLTSGTITYYLTWDNTNLYVGVTGYTNFVNDAFVLYIDANPITPVNGGNNSDGTLSGTAFDGVTPDLPFRADFFAFVKSGFDSWINDDGSNGWGSQNDNTLTKNFDDPNNEAEFSIPWSDITGSGRPASFNFVAFMSFNSGTFANAPTANPTGTTPELIRYFTVSTTADGNSTTPFSQESYTHLGGNISNFGALTIYDFTMNTSGASITRSSGQWTIGNDLLINDGTIDMGSSTTSVDVSNDCTVESGGTLTLSTGIGGDLKLGGDFILNGGTLNNNDRALFFEGSQAQSIGGTTSPINLDFVVVDNNGNTLTLNSDITVIDNAGAATEFTIRPLATVDATGQTLTVNGNLTIEEDATGYGQLIGDVTGSVSVQSRLDATGGARWFNVASPFNGGTVADFAVSAGSIQTANGFTANQVNIYYFDPTTADNSVSPAEGTWTMVPNTAFSTNNNAFSLYLGGTFFGDSNAITLTATGSNLNDGAVTIPIKQDNQGYNFVPNPYPSALDWNNYWDNNSSNLTAIYWIDNNGTFEGYDANNNITFDDPGVAGAGIGTEFIAPMQGFFVQTSADQNLSFANSNRTISSTPPKLKKNPSKLVKVSARASGASSGDATIVAFRSSYTDQWDQGLDAPKRMNYAAGVPNIYTTGGVGENYLVNNLQEVFRQKIVPMSFKSQQRGVYEINIATDRIPAGWQVYLEDKLLNTTVDIRNNSYRFGHAVGKNPDRFNLIFSQATVDLKEETQAQEIFAYTEQDQLFVNLEAFSGKGSLSLVSLSGATVQTVPVQGGQIVETSLAHLPKGLYIVRVISEGRTVHTQKIIK